MLCQLCKCEQAHNFHHLIPRTLHSNKWFKKRFTREQMRDGLEVCRACHRAVHDLIPDEKLLGREYNTLKKLREHPEVDKFLRWKRTKARRSRRTPSPPAG